MYSQKQNVKDKKPLQIVPLIMKIRNSRRYLMHKLGNHQFVDVITLCSNVDYNIML